MQSYLVTRPPNELSSEARAAFDALFDRAASPDRNGEIDYRLPWPRWQFICHIADTRPVIVHGSQDGGIAVFEPRKSNDAHPFGDRKAIFGASDGLWSMFYAILDRATHPMLLVNSAVRVEDEAGTMGEPLYFFSISRPALEARAFRPGMLYFLPREGFEPMPAEEFGGRRVHIAQWAKLEPARPITRIPVAPEDFPLLDQIRGHDDATVMARVKADPKGFPWVDP
jgi:hypothetical protein